MGNSQMADSQEQEGCTFLCLTWPISQSLPVRSFSENTWNPRSKTRSSSFHPAFISMVKLSLPLKKTTVASGLEVQGIDHVSRSVPRNRSNHPLLQKKYVLWGRQNMGAVHQAWDLEWSGKGPQCSKKRLFMLQWGQADVCLLQFVRKEWKGYESFKWTFLKHVCNTALRIRGLA